MKVNIWMPFYVGDYIADTTHLTTEQHGAYVLLLLSCWNRGGLLPPDDRQLAAMARLSPKRWRVLKPVIASFFLISTDGWRQKRVSEELHRAQQISDQARTAGLASAEARRKRALKIESTDVQRTFNGRSTEDPTEWQRNANPSQSQSQSQSTGTLSSSDTPIESVEAERPVLSEVLLYADKTGLAPWKAEDWFNEMEGCGWIDYQHRPVKDWRKVLTRVRVKWEADGRPKGPPTNLNNHFSDRTGGRKSKTLEEQEIERVKRETAQL